jgi:glycosyltransferase involved in cell wall biosynthesis
MAMLEQVRRRGIPAVAFVHDDWLDYGRRTDAWHRRIGKRSVDFARAARYVFVSEETRKRAGLSGLELPDTGIAHSGIDPSFLEQRAPEREWEWRLLYVGRLDERKGIGTVVEALAALPDASLRVVGSGNDAERARLESLIGQLGVGDRVQFAGAVPRSALPGEYAAADAVVFPVVWSEPWGLVPLEAMAIGRPVIATGRGGSGEYLRDGENCVLFEAGEPASLAAAVERLAADAALRSRLREGGFAVAPQHTEVQFNDAVLAELEHRRAGGD